MPAIDRRPATEQPSRALPQLVRFADLKRAGVVRNWPQVRKLVERENFPPGRMLSQRARAWRVDEIERWLNDRPLAGTPAVQPPAPSDTQSEAQPPGRTTLKPRRTHRRARPGAAP